jgi:hypothetical protein
VTAWRGGLARSTETPSYLGRETLIATEVTLDTNVLQELWRDQPKRAVVERLLALGEARALDLAITARIREDIPDEPLASKISRLPDLGVAETGSVARLGYCALGRDSLGSDAFEDFRLQLESSRKKGDAKLPDWRDLDHLHAHMLQERTVFLTWDRPILRLSQDLQDRFGIRVQAPEEFLEEIDTDATQDRS